MSIVITELSNNVANHYINAADSVASPVDNVETVANHAINAAASCPSTSDAEDSDEDPGYESDFDEQDEAENARLISFYGLDNDE